jgi:hypothetical protein
MALLLGLALAGCVPTPKADSAVRVIRYKVSPGFMGSGSFVLTVASNGEGRLELNSRDENNWRHWTKRVRRIRFTPMQFDAFEARLRAYRPTGELVLNDSPPCKEQVEDLADIEVQWSGGEAPPARLAYSLGCDMDERRQWAAELNDAPLLLGIRGLPLASGQSIAYTR